MSKSEAITKESILEAIGQMSVLDVKELVEMMEEKFGVSAAQPVAVAGVAASGGADAPAAAEQTEFTVMMTSFGEKKIEVIKTIRSITGLSLQDAKKLVEGVPAPVKENIAKDEAEKVKSELESAGATVELK